MSVFHRRKGEAEGDVEAGGREDHSGSTVAPPEPQAQHQAAPQENLPEYAALERYISTYREGSRMGDDNQKKRRNVKWWQFWRSTDADLMDDAEPAKRVVPEAWLDTDIQTGIRINEVDERRKWSGWNELSAEKENMFVKFLGFFTGPILYVMEVAALLAVGLGDWIDFGVICGILLLNAFVAFYQEKSAADVVASLKGDIAMRCTVVRDGQEQNILAREIVPGDILIIQ
jgi:H+-transporting ATPase